MSKSYALTFFTTSLLSIFFINFKFMFFAYVILGYGHFLLSYIYLVRNIKGIMITILFILLQFLLYFSPLSTWVIVLFSASIFYLHSCFNEYEISKSYKAVPFIVTILLSVISYIYIVSVYIFDAKEFALFSLENVVGFTILLHVTRWYFYLFLEKRYYSRDRSFVWLFIFANILFFVLYFAMMYAPQNSAIYSSLNELFSARLYYIAAAIHIFYTSNFIKKLLC